MKKEYAEKLVCPFIENREVKNDTWSQTPQNIKCITNECMAWVPTYTVKKSTKGYGVPPIGYEAYSKDAGGFLSHISIKPTGGYCVRLGRNQEKETE